MAGLAHKILLLQLTLAVAMTDALTILPGFGPTYRSMVKFYGDGPMGGKRVRGGSANDAIMLDDD